MKIKNILYTLTFTLVLFAVITGCKKADFDINKNPNSPTDSTVTFNVILPAALEATGSLVATDWGWLQNYMGFWARSGTYAPNTQEETYSLTTSSQTAVWNDIYDNCYDYQVMQNKAEASGKGADFYAGIARIMKSHNYQILVDFYNNAPYKQALKGNANVTPAYDKGIDVYKDLLRQIDAGITLIKGADTTKNSIVANDIMFAGSKSKWIRFANTLKLRLLIHLHNGWNSNTVVPGIDVAAEYMIIQNSVSDGMPFLQTGEDAQAQPGYVSNKPNPFWGTYKQDATGTTTANADYYKANKYAIDYYKQNVDLRINRFYVPGKTTTLMGATVVGIGVQYGLPSATLYDKDKLAGIGPGILKAVTQPQWIMTATESKFLQAEFLERYAPGTAGPALNEAIKESFYFLWGVFTTAPVASQAAIDGYVDGTYLANNATYSDVDYGAAAATNNNNIAGGLYTILAQKWFALNGIAPYEVFSDYRRTDIVYGLGGDYAPGPAISVSPNNTATKIPSRLLYPQSEYNYNSANVVSQGGVDRYGKVFWDLN